MGDHVIDVDQQTMGAGDHADADGDDGSDRRKFVRNAQRLNHGAHGIGQCPGFILAGIDQQHQELFATQAYHHIGFSTEGVFQHASDIHEAYITGRVAVVVVECLEVIDIDHHRRHRAAQAAAERNEHVELAFQHAPVAEPGQWIVQRLFQQSGMVASRLFDQFLQILRQQAHGVGAAGEIEGHLLRHVAEFMRKTHVIR